MNAVQNLQVGSKHQILFTEEFKVSLEQIISEKMWLNKIEQI